MKNFFDIKDEKTTEKAFSQSLLISVLSILLCIVALCSMTYAWFTGETASSSNTLTSGSFDVDVNIVKADGVSATVSEAVVFADGKYTLTAPGAYTVTLNPTPDATVKGYCAVTIDGSVYRTDVILDEDMVDEIYTVTTSPLEFTIVTEKADTVLKLESYWGVIVSPDIKKNTKITVQESHIEIKHEDATE